MSAGMGSVSTSVPVGLDFTAVLSMARALGIETELLAEVLPQVEAAILIGLSDDGEEGYDEVPEPSE